MNLLVLFGGRSAEHEISIQSARTVLAGLPAKYRAIPVFIARDGRWFLQREGEAGTDRRRPVLPTHRPWLVPAGGGRPVGPIRAAFPVLHGPFGEDGTIQGVLECARIPYVGSGVLGSALGMDKEVSKRLAQAAGLRVPRHALVLEGDDPRGILRRARPLGLPLFVKPARLGSSVGVRKVRRWGELAAAARHALKYDTKVLVEEAIDGMEVSVAVLGDEKWVETSVPGRILPAKGYDFYSYESKYLDEHGSELVIPAPLSTAKKLEVRTLAQAAFEELEGHGMARVDFLIDRRGVAYFGEINTIPGFTSHSLYPKLWEASGQPLPGLLDRLIELARARGRRAAALRVTPDV